MAKSKLLVIEDDPDVSELVCTMAEGMGFDTKSGTGQQATQLYDAFKPDIIALDILMPDMDGLEVLQMLKERGSQARIMIISGSSASQRQIVENLGNACHLRIVANIAKPFRLSELRTTLERVQRAMLAPEILRKVAPAHQPHLV